MWPVSTRQAPLHPLAEAAATCEWRYSPASRALLETVRYAAPDAATHAPRPCLAPPPPRVLRGFVAMAMLLDPTHDDVMRMAFAYRLVANNARTGA